MPPPAKVRARRRAVAGLVVTVLLVGVLFVSVFPTKTWWQQRKDTAQTQSQLAEVRAELAKVRREEQQLRTADEIARRAKEELGYVKPGEEAYNILPAPTAAIGLPDGWPFIGVERVFGAR